MQSEMKQREEAMAYDMRDKLRREDRLTVVNLGTSCRSICSDSSN